MEEEDTKPKRPCIPGVTDNKKAMTKLIGMIMLAGVLNQRKYTFDYYNTKAFVLYFSSSTNPYETELVEQWWFAFEAATIIISLIFIKKFKPVFFYGTITLIVGIGQFVIAFFEQHKLEAYGMTIGITGGIGSGSVWVLPFYILCMQFKPKDKAIVTSIFLMSQALISEVFMYQLLRALWWGHTEVPKTAEDLER
jgi:hypothetical protein